MANYRRDSVTRGAKRIAREAGQTTQQFWSGLRRSGGAVVDENGSRYERSATFRYRGRRGARARARGQRILNAQTRREMMGRQPDGGDTTNS